ncbi:unnamed protein product [Penicillium discolor]
MPTTLRGAEWPGPHPKRSSRPHSGGTCVTEANDVGGKLCSTILGVNYTKQLEMLNALKRQSQRLLTLTEKLLYSHLITGDKEWDLETIERGKTILELRPDRLACHDATATMAFLQFISAGLPRVMAPTTVHSDHLIISEKGASEDLERAISEHAEVFGFLSNPESGMLPLTFDDSADYVRVAEGDRITLLGVEDGEFQPRKQVVMKVEPRQDLQHNPLTVPGGLVYTRLEGTNPMPAPYQSHTSPISRIRSDPAPQLPSPSQNPPPEPSSFPTFGTVLP